MASTRWPLSGAIALEGGGCGSGGFWDWFLLYFWRLRLVPHSLGFIGGFSILDRTLGSVWGHNKLLLVVDFKGQRISLPSTGIGKTLKLRVSAASPRGIIGDTETQVLDQFISVRAVRKLLELFFQHQLK